MTVFYIFFYSTLKDLKDSLERYFYNNFISQGGLKKAKKTSLKNGIFTFLYACKSDEKGSL
jgi:hypothetical protein